MSRSGYTEDYENSNLWRLWRGAVTRAINGQRGQAMLRDLLMALDAMPEKRLAAESLVTPAGEFCTLGALGHARGIDLKTLDPEDAEAVATAFGIAPAMAREIVFENDECEDGHKCVAGQWRYEPETPTERWQRMRDWVAKNLKSNPAEVSA